MDIILGKLIFISKLNNLNNNLIQCEKLIGKVNTNYKVNKKSSNCMKISVECNAFDVNEDKQRQCYKQMKCFWPKCRFSAKHKRNLEEHIFNHINKRQFVCKECNKQFHQNSTLLNHKRNIHSNVRPFICHRKDCNKRFKTNSNLKSHLLRHSSVKSFVCNKCDQRFKTIEGYKKHHSVHTNVRPFDCPQNDCNKTFKRKSDLTAHQSIHLNKPFKCKKCDQLFSDKNSLISHKCFHYKQKRFECDFKYCDKRFVTRYNLKEHKDNVHFGIKSYQCFHNNCNKSFFKFFSLESHIRHKHSTDRPFKCNFQQCQSSFKCIASLRRHKLVHSRISQLN